MKNLIVLLIGVVALVAGLYSLHGTLSKLHCHEATQQGIKS